MPETLSKKKRWWAFFPQKGSMKYQDISPRNINEYLFDLGWVRIKPNLYSFNRKWNQGISYTLHILDEWMLGVEFQYEFPITVRINLNTPISYSSVLETTIENYEQLKKHLDYE